MDSARRSSLAAGTASPSSSTLLLSSLELNDAKVYEPSRQALLETASQFSKVVVLNLLPCTGLWQRISLPVRRVHDHLDRGRQSFE